MWIWCIRLSKYTKMTYGGTWFVSENRIYRTWFDRRVHCKKNSYTLPWCNHYRNCRSSGNHYRSLRRTSDLQSEFMWDQRFLWLRLYFSVHTGKKKYRIPAPVKGKYQKRMYHHRCRKRQNRYSRRSDCPRNGGLLYRRASDGRLWKNRLKKCKWIFAGKCILYSDTHN